MKEPQICSECSRDIDEGREVIEVVEGVEGLRGFVSLSEPWRFCGAKCLKDFFNHEGDTKFELPRRIP